MDASSHHRSASSAADELEQLAGALTRSQQTAEQLISLADVAAERLVDLVGDERVTVSDDGRERVWVTSAELVVASWRGPRSAGRAVIVVVERHGVFCDRYGQRREGFSVASVKAAGAVPARAKAIVDGARHRVSGGDGASRRAFLLAAGELVQRSQTAIAAIAAP